MVDSMHPLLLPVGLVPRDYIHVGAGLDRAYDPANSILAHAHARGRGGDYLSPAPSSDAHAIVGRGLGDLILKVMLKGTVL